MSSKNIKMISLVVVLLIANAFLFLSKPSYSSIDYDPAMLAISDTSAVDKISLSYKGTDHVFARSTNWRMNEKFAFDFNLRQILFLVTQRVRVSRKVVGEEASAVLAYAASGGADVIIESGGDELTYRVVGNPTQTKTFFVSEGEVYEMEIPGYRDYIGGIYQLTPDQWKDRLVFNGNWRTIQQVIIDHADGEAVTIKFDQDFFRVSELAAIDSSAVVDYLNQYEFLQANERISRGFLPVYDSLAESTPEVVLTMDDIKYQEDTQLSIFPAIPGQNMRLVMDQNGELMVFEERRIQGLMKRRSDFAF